MPKKKSLVELLDAQARRVAKRMKWGHWAWLLSVEHCESAPWDRYVDELVEWGVLDEQRLDLPLADALHRIVDDRIAALKQPQRERILGMTNGIGGRAAIRGLTIRDPRGSKTAYWLNDFGRAVAQRMLEPKYCPADTNAAADRVLADFQQRAAANARPASGHD